MEARMKPERRTAPLPTNPFSKRFQEDCERWRLRHFLSSGFQDIEGAVCTTYHVKPAEGVGEERLLSFLKGALGGQEIPPIVPEAARGRTLMMFREAEAAGLVRLEKACVSPLR